MHMNKAEIGDVVRSFDFQPMPDRGDCFVEGIVIDKDAGMYEIVVQKRVFAGKIEEVNPGETVRTAWELLMPGITSTSIPKLFT